MSLVTLPDGPLNESVVNEHIRPLFSRAMKGDAKRGEVYLANHSLGRPLDAVAEDVARGLEKWYSDMDRSWDDGGWLDDMNAWRLKTAELLGLPRYDCVVPRASAGQGLRAVLNAFPPDKVLRVTTTTGEFDSIDFILKRYELAGRAKVTWVEPTGREGPVPLFTSEDICAAISSDTDVVVFSNVLYATGQILRGVPAVVERAHEVGAVVVMDVFHAAGVIPLEIEKSDVDFTIGGSYKYLHGGPGACWLAIHPRVLDEDRFHTLDTGWFAKKDTFGFHRGQGAELKPGGDGWLESTPAIIAPYHARAGLQLILDVGVERGREYSLDRQHKMRQAMNDRGVEMFVPEDPAKFGGFSLLPHPDAAALRTELMAKGVNTDARTGFVRFGPDLLNTEEEFERASKIVAEALKVRAV
ncbi:MAG: aminotransferase class V-fold PLP-dependent enzyme [Armatimonadetes bacterium]|nr:aminotransferase class V-fold PLP-dependent enzyme [Armatimonadota bacterium]